MRVRIMLAIAAVGGTLGLASPAAHAFGVAQNCTRPTTGQTLTPNEPCWVAGVYNDDYTGMSDVDYIGAPAQQSGAHPFTGVTDFIVASTSPAVSNIRVDIPPGLVSNPLATPKCSDAALQSNSCPNNTQLGIVKLEANLGLNIFVGSSVFNMNVESNHCSGYVSDYAFNATGVGRVDICGSVNRQPPYNLYFTIVAPPGAATVQSTLVFWGVPGDSGHNPQRQWSCPISVSPCTPPTAGPSSPSGMPFLTNPTSCLAAGAVSTLTLTGGGQTATATSPTPVAAVNCLSLPFSPKLKLQLKGGNQTKPGKHPTLIANLTQGAGQANIAGSKVTLPLSLALDPKNSQHVCQPSAAFNDTCPSQTVIGTARATTPLLNVPLAGKVYLVQGIACSSHQQPSLLGVCPSGQAFHTTPALLVALRGGGAAIDLHAQTSVAHNKFLVTTFFALPDLPVSSFQLTIKGGKRGILVVTGNKSLCAKRRQVASSVFTGQNGKPAPSKIKMKTPCKK
jgi:hypothetical protein